MKRALVALAAAPAFAVSLLVVAPAASAATPTLWIGAGTNWASVLSSAPAGATVGIRPNATPYPALRLSNLNFPGITITGDPAAPSRSITLESLELVNTSGLTLKNLTVTSSETQKESAIRVRGTSGNMTFTDLTVANRYRIGISITDAAHDVVVDGVRVDSSAAVHDASGRNILIQGTPGTASSTWPRNITVRNSDLGGAAVDAVDIYRGVNVTLQANTIHDVQVDDVQHNDGIQVSGGISLNIIGNRISSGGPRGGPDQGIMIGRPPSDNAQTSDIVVQGNIVADWRGTGIIVAGADRIDVTANSVARNYGGIAVSGTNTVLHINNNVTQNLTGAAGSESGNCLGRTITAQAPTDIVDTTIGSDLNLVLSASSPCRTMVATPGAQT
jgi:hypothetical protein